MPLTTRYRFVMRCWGGGGYLSLWLLYWAFRLATGREGLGYGDFKLLAALGAWCGWQALPVIVLVAALSGIVGYFAFNNLNKNNLTISFGPYLSFAGIAVLTAAVRVHYLNIQVKILLNFFDEEREGHLFFQCIVKDISYTDFGLVSFYGGIQHVIKILVTVLR
jgi:hypothetical protein